MISAVYIIVNRRNGKRYVGQATDVIGRFTQHRAALRQGRHGNSHLQAAWKKYGPGAFVFEVYREVPPEKLTETEQFLLDAYRDLLGERMVYNKRLDCVDSPRGTVQPEEANARRREWNAQLEVKARQRATQRQRWSDPDYRAKMTAVSRRVHGDPARRDLQARRNWPEGAVGIELTSPEGERHLVTGSLAPFCEQHGLTRTAISQLLNGIGRARRHKGWTARYALEPVNHHVPPIDLVRNASRGM